LLHPPLSFFVIALFLAFPGFLYRQITPRSTGCQPECTPVDHTHHEVSRLLAAANHMLLSPWVVVVLPEKAAGSVR
jgi:hypothetical protein